MLAAGEKLSLKPAVLATFACVAAGGLALCKSPKWSDHLEGALAADLSPLEHDLVTGEVVVVAAAQAAQAAQAAASEAGGSASGAGGEEEQWLKVFVRGKGDAYLPLRDPATGACLLEPFGRTGLREGDPVRVRDVSEEEAERAMEGNGGWSPGMGPRLGQRAVVFEVLDGALGRVHLRHAGTTTFVWASSLVVRIKPGTEGPMAPTPPPVVRASSDRTPLSLVFIFIFISISIFISFHFHFISFHLFSDYSTLFFK